MDEERPFTELVRDRAEMLAASGVCALGSLFDLTSRRLVRFAVTLTRHQQDAEDSVQTVLVRVAARPRLLADANCPWAYLLRMVRNEALTMKRRQKRLGLRQDLMDLLTRCRVDELEREEKYRAVWKALRKLPTEQAEVVVLKIWEELTFARIADVLEISPHTAASRYKYALQKLAHTLQELRREIYHE